MLGELSKQYPDIKFRASNRFVWSPRHKTVFYDQNIIKTPQGNLALLHELSHALLGHQTYKLDVELLGMELEAWTKAKEIAPAYDIDISEDHIQDCLETYRIWLFKRSRCPVCENTSFQENESTYRCFNCGGKWQVAQSKSLHPRRMKLAFG